MTIMMLPVGEVSKKYIPNLLRRYRRASAAIAIAQADGGVDGLEAEVARGEIEFFVIARVIRDVHLAVFAGDAAVAVEYHRRVVVKPGRTAFKQRRHDHHAAFARERGERLGTRTRDGLGPIEKADVFVLAEITADVQLLQQY